MEEFNAEDYYDELVDFVQKSGKITEREEFISRYLAKSDDTKPYCVGDGFYTSIDVDEMVFTEAAFLLTCFCAYEDNSLECSLEDLVSGSSAENYSELVKECEKKDFSFQEYLDYEGREGFCFMIEDSFAEKNNLDKGRMKEIWENYKDKKVDYDLKTLAEKLYGNDVEWIFKGRK